MHNATLSGEFTSPLELLVRAKKSTRVPVVLTRDEMSVVLQRLQGRYWLMASLMYGTGMRVMECLRLRIQDIDFGYRQITVHNGPTPRTERAIASESRFDLFTFVGERDHAAMATALVVGHGYLPDT